MISFRNLVNPVAVGVLLVIFGLGFAISPYGVVLPGPVLVFLEIAMIFCLFGMLVLGLNLQYGFTGLINFGHVGFYAVGAYTTAMLVARDPYVGVGLGFPWIVGLVAAVITASLFGAIIGLTTIRLRDDFLAIATLAAAEIFYRSTRGIEVLFGSTIGITNVPRPVHNVSNNSDTAMFVTVILLGGLLLIIYTVINRLTSSPYGRVLRAIRADDKVSEALGKDVFRYKMEAFVIGAGLAGFAGGIFALVNGSVAPSFFTIIVTILVWIGMILGGPGENWGVLVGLGVILSLRLTTRYLNETVPVSRGEFAAFRLMLIGLILVAIIRYKPEGIFGNADALGVEK